jgi:hypothetical protein
MRFHTEKPANLQPIAGSKLPRTEKFNNRSQRLKYEDKQDEAGCDRK